MTPHPDIHEIMRASLRRDYLAELRTGILSLDEDETRDRSQLNGEHALDAALARGATLEQALWAARELIDETIRIRAAARASLDEALGRDPDATPPPPAPDTDPGDFANFAAHAPDAARREVAIHALAARDHAMRIAAEAAIIREFTRRAHDRGLDPDTARYGDVLTDTDLTRIALATI